MGVRPHCGMCGAPFLFIAEYCPPVWLHHILFICAWVDDHLGCFYFVAIVNNAGVNIPRPAFVQVRVFIVPGYLPRVIWRLLR